MLVTQHFKSQNRLCHGLKLTRFDTTRTCSGWCECVMVTLEGLLRLIGCGTYDHEQPSLGGQETREPHANRTALLGTTALDQQHDDRTATTTKYRIASRTTPGSLALPASPRGWWQSRTGTIVGLQGESKGRTDGRGILMTKPVQQSVRNSP